MLGWVGCAGSGTGSLSGTLYVARCTPDKDLGSLTAPVQYDMHPSYFVADPVDDLFRIHPNNRLAIRVQPSGNRLDEADALYINIASDREVAASLGQAMTIGPSSNTRAALLLHQLCPNAISELELDGTLTFSAFGSANNSPPADDFRISYGDRLTATFSLDVIDRRAVLLGGNGSVATTPQTAGHLAGDFDFSISRGKSAQKYP